MQPTLRGRPHWPQALSLVTAVTGKWLLAEHTASAQDRTQPEGHRPGCQQAAVFPGARAECTPPWLPRASLKALFFCVFFLRAFSLLLSFTLPARLKCLAVTGGVFTNGSRAEKPLGEGAGRWQTSPWVTSWGTQDLGTLGTRSGEVSVNVRLPGFGSGVPSRGDANFSPPKITH